MIADVSRPEAQQRAYADAMRAALEDLRSLMEDVKWAKRRLHALEAKIRERRTLVDSLMRLVDDGDAREIEAEFKDVLRFQSPEVTGLSEFVQKTFEVLEDSKSRPLGANEIRERLEAGGLCPDPKAVYNVLQRMAKKGMLVKVARGRYRVPEYGAGVLTSDHLLPDEED